MNQIVEIKPIQDEDHTWVKEMLFQHWGSEYVVSRGTVHQADLLPGLIAWQNNQRVGLITYHIENTQCEIVTINNFLENVGIGSKLVDAVQKKARELECPRIWLITTNDNTRALTFYQKYGFIITAFYKNAVATSRKLKPEIPDRGYKDIPIRDEIELEIWLQ